MDNNDYPASWTESYPYVEAAKDRPHTCLNGDPPAERNAKGQPTRCVAAVRKEESVLSDQLIRDSCIQQIQAAANLTGAAGNYSNFFIGCGFHKPHVPWTVPHEFFGTLPRPFEAYGLAAWPWAPVGMPAVAWHEPGDVGGINASFNSSCANATRARLYRWTYDAAVAYTDYNIGRVLSALDSTGLASNTIVVVFGDHGWHLGENDLWAKMSNFELATHIPLIVRHPAKPQAVNKSATGLVEAVDLYLTLAELTGLPPPEEMGQQLNGTSFASMFDDPATVVKDAAFSQFAKTNTDLAGRPDPFNVNPKYFRNQTTAVGYSIRTVEWRYTVWFSFDNSSLVPSTDTMLGRELYDHRADTGLWLDFPESHNLVGDARYAQVVDALDLRVREYIQLRPVIREAESTSKISSDN